MSKQLDLTEQKPYRQRLISDEELHDQLSEILSRCKAGDVRYQRGVSRFLDAVALVLTKERRKFNSSWDKSTWQHVPKLVEMAAETAWRFDLLEK
jgi:hypothetical protein